MKEYAGRVLIIVQNLPVPFDRRVWLEAKTLRNHGYRVSVISPKSKEFSRSYETLDDIHIFRYAIPFEAFGFWGYFLEFIYAWFRTAILTAKVYIWHGFDVIHACNPPDTYFLLARIYRLLGVRFIFDHHDLSPEMYRAKFPKKSNKWVLKTLLLLEKLTFATADVVLATNQSYKSVAIERGMKNASDVFVVRTGPDLHRLEQRIPHSELKREKPYMVCYLGEMCPQDGVDYLLDSIRILVYDIGITNVHFCLIGGGPSLADLKSLSIQMHLGDYVEFTGRVSDDLLCDYLSTADICVDPDPYSEWANHSTMNKVMEYMTFSKPIVSFDLYETKLTASKAALFVPANDTTAFANGILKLLQHPELRTKMGAFGRQRVLSTLSWQHSVPALLGAYSCVLGHEKIQTCRAIKKPDSKPSYLIPYK
jgi:glycosyltransferase involved in cell wall biosynthesis